MTEFMLALALGLLVALPLRAALRWRGRRAVRQEHERSEFQQRCDTAESIPTWDDRMDALIELMRESPAEYVEWARQRHRLSVRRA